MVVARLAGTAARRRLEARAGAWTLQIIAVPAVPWQRGPAPVMRCRPARGKGRKLGENQVSG
jgi:hypothetical protein